MMFVLSKVLLILIFPITWVFVIFILALLAKNPKRKQRLFLTGMIVFYLFSIPAPLDFYVKCWDYPSGKLTKPVYSAAIVLGGFTSEKADHTGYFNGASDRFIQGVKLKETGKVSHILISGGNGMLMADSFREGDWVHGQLKQFNIPDSSILIENQSRNTIENALFTKKLLAAAHLAPPYVLVTSAFHMRRSMLIFKKVGLDVVPYSCAYVAGVRKFGPGSFMPESYVFATWELYTKELVGTVVAWLRKF